MKRKLYKTVILGLITITCITIVVINNLASFNSTKWSFLANRKIQVVSERDKYIKRAEAIRELCAVTHNDPTNKVPLRTDRFKYSHSAKTVLCETPKVASTSWQIALLKLGGFEEEITAETMTKWAYSMIPNQLFSKLKTNEEAIELLHNYTTILVTRHPFEQLVSAYRNKLSDQADHPYYRDTVGKQIAKDQASLHIHGLSINNVRTMTPKQLKTFPNFRNLNEKQQKEVLAYSYVLKTGAVSFLQFVKFLTKYSKKMNLTAMDIHWRPQTHMCIPCRVNYTYIIRFDNLVKESNEVLGWIQQEQTSFNRSLVSISGNITQSVKNLTTRSYFSELDESDVDILRKIYADDFKLLNFDRYAYNGTFKG